MKVLAFSVAEKIKSELKKVFEEHNNEISFVDKKDGIIDELKKEKYNVLILAGDSLEYEDLISLIESSLVARKKLIIFVTGERSNIKIVAGSIKAGAYDYILSPLDPLKIMMKIEKSIKDQKLKSERINGQDYLLDDEEIIGTTDQMVEVYKLVGKVSGSEIPVLITGESGTGKGIIAKEIHKFSDRSNSPFVTVNCNAIHSSLLEKELWGYEKGAFPGATMQKKGEFEEVNGGVLFLDEIGSLDLDIQAKLLRVLEKGEFTRVGGVKPIDLDVRIIASTNKDLEELMIEGKFREELYHRLKVVEIEIPPLRERRDDIPFLIDYFIKKYNEDLGIEIKGVSKPALTKLIKYDWPGNVRELKNATKSSMAVCRSDNILIEDLPANVIGAKISKRHGDLQDWVLADWIEGEIEILKKNNKKNYFGNIIYRVERELIRQVLESTNGKKVDTAEILGITRNTLRAKMNNYGLE